MKRNTTVAAGVDASALVEEAFQEVGASFERFCLTAGIATLQGMLEEDAARLCGPPHAAIRSGRAIAGAGRGASSAFMGGRLGCLGHASGRGPGSKFRCRAGRRPWPTIGWADGR